MANKLEFFVAKLKVLVALATVSVAISSPNILKKVIWKYLLLQVNFYLQTFANHLRGRTNIFVLDKINLHQIRIYKLELLS